MVVHHISAVEYPPMSRSLDDVRKQLRGTYEMLRGSTIDVENYTPSLHGSLITFDGVPDLEEVDRYWVDAPFAFVSINFDPDEHEHRYHVV